MQFSRVSVRLGSDVAPDGTHVYLDVPGGKFDFVHHVVESGKLNTPLLSDYDYWCLWSPTKLPALPATFEPHGGVYPLPARVRSGKLHLPAERRLKVKVINLGDEGAAEQISTQVQSAKALYAQLGIDVQVEVGERPAGDAFAGNSSLTKEGKGFWVVSSSKGKLGADENSVKPDFSSAAWAGPQEILVLWMQRFDSRAGKKRGIAFPPFRHTEGTPAKSLRTLHFTPPPAGIVFMNPRPTGGASVTKPLAHELGHVLVDTMGLGHWVMSNEKLSGLKEKAQQFLKSLRLESPPRNGEVLFYELHDGGYNTGHVTGSDLTSEYLDKVLGAGHPVPGPNILRPTGGSTFLPYQVAVIRACPDLQDA